MATGGAEGTRFERAQPQEFETGSLEGGEGGAGQKVDFGRSQRFKACCRSGVLASRQFVRAQDASAFARVSRRSSLCKGAAWCAREGEVHGAGIA